MNELQPFAIWAPSGWELIVVMVIALLLFGTRLPEVARNLGKGVVEFKKGPPPGPFPQPSPAEPASPQQPPAEPQTQSDGEQKS